MIYFRSFLRNGFGGDKLSHHCGYSYTDDEEFYGKSRQPFHLLVVALHYGDVVGRLVA